MTSPTTGAGRLAALRDTWSQTPVTTKLYWLLRVGVAIEYLGHGWAGLSRSQAWLPYYDLFGISANAANSYLMYVTGTVDITVGLIVLIWPVRIVLLHATVWGVFTALLRPVVGEGWWEFLERGGNYGMPLALLILVGVGTPTLRGWILERADAPAPASVSDRRHIGVHWAARIGLGLLLIGHGGFGVFEHKKYFYDFFAFFGADRGVVDSANLMVVFGLFEILLGIAVIIRPAKPLLLFVLGWKLVTELLRPLVGQELFQFVERDGDYVLPIALIIGAGVYAAARVRARSMS